jgi:hypothetical protein
LSGDTLGKLANVRLGWKWLAVMEALAYNTLLFNATIKSFMKEGLAEKNVI